MGSNPQLVMAQAEAIHRFTKWLNEHTLVTQGVRYCGLSSLSRQEAHDQVKLGAPYTSPGFKMRNSQHALVGLVVQSLDLWHTRRQPVVVVSDIECIMDDQL